MESKSKSELLKHVEQQQEKLSRYETKFKDIVSAYKALMKEKTALQNSLRILSSQHLDASSSVAPPSQTHGCSARSSEQSLSGSEDDPCSAQLGNSIRMEPHKSGSIEHTESDTTIVHSEAGNAAVADHICPQVAALSASLAALSNEKTRVEGSFQADKKKLIGEKEELIERIRNLELQSEEHAAIGRAECESFKLKLCTEQKNREEEQKTHSVVIRELQATIRKEHDRNASLSKELTEKKADGSTVGSMKKELDQCRQELIRIKASLAFSEEQVRELNVERRNLNKALGLLQREFDAKLNQERDVAQHVESRSGELMQAKENQLSALESRLADVLELVSKYERTRMEDREQISKLEDQLKLQLTATLDARNIPLNFQNLSSNGGKTWLTDSPDSVERLVEQMCQIKARLRTANEKLDTPFNMNELLASLSLDDFEEDDCTRLPELLKRCELVESCETEADADHVVCQEMCHKLKAELDETRGRLEYAESLLWPARTDKDGAPKKTAQSEVAAHVKLASTANGEGARAATSKQFCDKCSPVIVSLEKQIARLNEECAKNDQLTVKLDIMAEKLAKEKRSHSIAMDLMRVDCENRCKVLEQKVSDRQEKLLEVAREKDEEIAQLRRDALDLRRRTVERGDEGGLTSDSDGSDEKIVRSLVKSPCSVGPGTVFYQNQELAHQESIIGSLRRELRQLESILCSERRENASHEEKLVRQLAMLKDEVGRLQRQQSREGVNMEYLKNTILSFVLASETKRKLPMVNAISLLLKFSPAEMDSVNRALGVEVTSTAGHK